MTPGDPERGITPGVEAGRVSGRIIKVITSPMKFMGYTVRASEDEPQYQIKSLKADHIAVHKGSALTRLTRP